MEITRLGSAGTLESCDAAVTVEPRAAGAVPAIDLVVEGGDGRFSRRVEEAALSALKELGVARARISIRDRSALDCTVRARVLTACLRAAGEGESRPAEAVLPWEAARC
jgi:citrate lyase subunit gamma (acyl carrier protein)